MLDRECKHKQGQTLPLSMGRIESSQIDIYRVQWLSCHTQLNHWLSYFVLEVCKKMELFYTLH